jgi:hypothetical protein
MNFHRSLSNLITLSVVLLLFSLGIAQSQEPTSVLTEKAQVVETLDFSAWDTSVTPERVEKLLIRSVETSKLRPFQKIRANLILKTNFAPKLKQQLVLEATSKLIEDGKVSAQSGDVVALVDWDAILAFLEKLLPLLLQLFG